MPTQSGFYWAELRHRTCVVEVEIVERDPDALLDAAFPGRCHEMRIWCHGSEIEVDPGDVLCWGPQVTPWSSKG